MIKDVKNINTLVEEPMSKLFIAAVMSLSTSAFANVCHVDMVDTYTNRLIERFRSYDEFDGCKEGMKACRKEIRMRGLVNRADCLRDSIGPVPTPVPTPVPVPTPIPTPDYGRDARRHIQVGESVIMNSSYFTVLGTSFNGLYAVKNTWNQITNGVIRESLAVTSGCNIGLCVNDQVISLSSLSYVTVVGLEFDDRFVTKNTWNQLTSNEDRSNLAETKGCIQSYYSQICVGNQVINQFNQYSTVVGLQMNGKVVLKNNWNQLTTNVEPSSLVITR